MEKQEADAPGVASVRCIVGALLVRQQLAGIGRAARSGERGFSLVEVIVAIALLSIIGVGLLSALGTGLQVMSQADISQSARNLAELQMEHLKQLGFQPSGQYPPAAIPAAYADYTVAIDADPINGRDAFIQLVTVTVSHNGEEVASVQGYKVSQ
jgi:prepilin-type N-terminal cleavage/methylation domain-containing protein